MRKAPRSSLVHLRAIVAAALALGLVLALVTVVWATPSVPILSGPTGSTNDTMPVFGFSVDLDATVECSIDQGTPVYGPCSDEATHTHVPAAPLSDGEWFFRVKATDIALEEIEASRPFTVDTVAPAVPVVSGPTGPTNVAAPSFGFTAEFGATVECSVDDGTPAYGPCTSPPTSHTVAAPLADGPYHFRVRATDAAGNQSPEASRAFTVDTVAPAAPVVSGPTLTNDVTPSFGFTAEPGATKECSVDQGTPAYAPCTAPHTAAALTDGAWFFRVRATDAAGNQGPEASRAFVVDTVAPAAPVVSGPTLTNDVTPSFGFTAEPGATFRCSVDHGMPAYGSCTAPHTAPVLADGDYVFRVRATDAAGNQGPEASQAFEVDSEAPSLSIDSGPAGPTNVAAPSFGFTAEPDATVECSIDQEDPPYGVCTSLTTHVVGTPLSEGTHVFRVRAIDTGGNDAIQLRTFTVDTSPPSLSIGFGPSGTTSDSTPLFGFSTDGVTVACSIDQGTPAYGPCASATTHAAAAPLADGAYVFRVRATDAAGNPADVTRAFTVDTAPQTPDPGSPTPDPASPGTPGPSGPRLMSPFPLVRISGTLTSKGARIRLLTVRAPRGAIVRVSVSPPCSKKKRSSRRCHVLQAAGRVGRSAVIGFGGLTRTYRSGTVIVVRVWSADRIGKYTRFTILRGKAPRRVDRCLVPEATHGSRCPSA